MIYHDESIFNANEAQTWMWRTLDKPAILPKTRGSGIMVSDFIEEHKEGYWTGEKFMCQIDKAHIR